MKCARVWAKNGSNNIILYKKKKKKRNGYKTQWIFN